MACESWITANYSVKRGGAQNKKARAIHELLNVMFLSICTYAHLYINQLPGAAVNSLLLSTFSTCMPSFRVLETAVYGAETTSSPFLRPERMMMLLSSWMPVVTCTCFTLPAL